jgi:hypothetical protein
VHTTKLILAAPWSGLPPALTALLSQDKVDFRTASLHVVRVKQGTPSTHPILGDDAMALRDLGPLGVVDLNFD